MEPLSRPVPPRTPSDRVRAWVEWFGVGRLLAASSATVIVVFGGYWLVRMPPPTTEATLPQAVAVTTELPSTTPSPPTTDAPSAILVHVAGAVVAPGVHELGPDARVRDALVAAGGPVEGADANAVNLASPVTDGTRIYVPLLGERVPQELVVVAGDATAEPPGPVDVNRATAEELDVLPGVGPATATAIVTERDRNGPFASVDDLVRVPGIGPAKLAALRDLVTV
ncbi:MAG: ComEA family DNA-binding protein [Ilumatobacteraceae bacterium]